MNILEILKDIFALIGLIFVVAALFGIGLLCIEDFKSRRDTKDYYKRRVEELENELESMRSHQTKMSDGN